jgi:hypothetical protein
VILPETQQLQRYELRIAVLEVRGKFGNPGKNDYRWKPLPEDISEGITD